MTDGIKIVQAHPPEPWDGQVFTPLVSARGRYEKRHRGQPCPVDPARVDLLKRKAEQYLKNARAMYRRGLREDYRLVQEVVRAIAGESVRSVTEIHCLVAIQALAREGRVAWRRVECLERGPMQHTITADGVIPLAHRWTKTTKIGLSYLPRPRNTLLSAEQKSKLSMEMKIKHARRKAIRERFGPLATTSVDKRALNGQIAFLSTRIANNSIKSPSKQE